MQRMRGSVPWKEGGVSVLGESRGVSSPRLDAEEEGLSALERGWGFGAEREMAFCSGGGRWTEGSSPRRGNEPSSDILALAFE